MKNTTQLTQHEYKTLWFNFVFRVLKDAQIELMLKLFDQRDYAHLIEECEVVAEYRRSGRIPHKPTRYCTARQVRDLVAG